MDASPQRALVPTSSVDRAHTKQKVYCLPNKRHVLITPSVYLGCTCVLSQLHRIHPHTGIPTYCISS